MLKRLIITLGVFWSGTAFSFPSVTIQSVTGAALDGPAHHGLLIQTNGIWDPNLSYYEIQVAPSGNNPVIPWMVYNTRVKPIDASAIAIPYRNGIVALQTGVIYCVSLRAVYANQVTSWSQKCGVQLGAGATVSGDTDGDGVDDLKKYALGLDLNNPDTDDDGVSDGVELAQGTDPTKLLVASVDILTPALDFGPGTMMGTNPGQHQVLVIVNKSAQPAKISGIEVTNDQFLVGAYPKILSHIPPYNVARIPVSFLPHERGNISAKLKVIMANNQPLTDVTLKGAGVSIPNCSVLPGIVNFGTKQGQDAATIPVTVSNMAIGGPVPPPDDKMGDFAFPCFQLAKHQGRAPREIATELAAQLRCDPHYIAELKATGPYLIGLASAFSRFYQNYRLMDADPAFKNVAVMLVWSVRQVLHHGLLLLGVPPIERM